MTRTTATATATITNSNDISTPKIMTGDDSGIGGSHSYHQSWEPKVAELILDRLRQHPPHHSHPSSQSRARSRSFDNGHAHGSATAAAASSSSTPRCGLSTVLEKTGLTSTTSSSNNNNNNKMPVEEKVEEDDGSTSSTNRPFMVALVGIPGGGKSVSSLLLANMLDGSGLPTMIMPHDGYHYPMDHLRQFPNPHDIIYRRGAPDTFDPNSLKRDLDRIRNNTLSEEGLILVPGFDHARGDPEPNAHAFDRHHHRVVIAEGLYLLHDGDGWEDIASFFDLKIFIHSDVDNCMERLKIRNLAIPGYTPEEILVRVEEVDRVNARTVLKSQHRADMVVESIVSKPASFVVDDDDKDDFQSHHSHSSVGGGRRGRHTRVPSMEALNLIVTTLDMDQDDYHYISDSDFGEGAMTTPTEPLAPMYPLIGTWEKDMAEQIHEKLKEQPHRRPFMVGLVGMPGSGKSASVFLLANELEQRGLMSMTMPHDGYHYTRDYLKSFVNAEDALYRRGAPDTFDSSALYRDIDRIRNNPLKEDLIKVPGFDHANADPEPDQHIFDRHHHDVVICEGLYLLHDADGWEPIRELFDFTIFMESDVDVCIERVKIRNQCIPGYSPEEVAERADTVDRQNAITVLHSKYRADVVVASTALKKDDDGKINN